MSVWAGLIERLEKATEGSRELDAEICRVVGISWSSDEDGNFGGYGIMPRRVRFTESIDAALTLVPDDSEWFIQRYADGRTEVGILHTRGEYDHGRRAGFTAQNTACTSTTAPLALCIASIKARVSHGVDEPG